MKKFKFVLLGLCIFSICGFTFPKHICAKYKLDKKLCTQKVLVGDILNADVSKSNKKALVTLLIQGQLKGDTFSSQNDAEYKATERVYLEMKRRYLIERQFCIDKGTREGLYTDYASAVRHVDNDMAKGRCGLS